MIELLFVTCLATAPDNCRDRSLMYTEDTGLMACMLHGQAQIAKWAETHPGEQVQGWKCRHTSMREVRA
jgi:hypothetical protein